MKNKILITGAAGFIGFHLSKRFCYEGWDVTGLDNLNNYYDINLKKARLDLLKKENNFIFHLLDLLDREKINEIFKMEKFDYVVNLAAQAGVRYSLTKSLCLYRLQYFRFHEYP